MIQVAESECITEVTVCFLLPHLSHSRGYKILADEQIMADMKNRTPEIRLPRVAHAMASAIAS
jgi:hypothetical protein